MEKNDNLEIYSRAFSKALDIPIFNIEKLKNLRNYPKINLLLYQEYIDNFVKCPGSKEIFSWQIISDHLKNLEN